MYVVNRVRILAKPEVCMGCHLCEIWCAVAHSKSKDIIKAFMYEEPRPVSRIRVEDRIPVTFAIQCRNCDEPECVAACISGALYKDADGNVVHDESKCVGCYSCVMACPYGSVKIDDRTQKVVKCDLCDGDPQCVKMCPNDALIIVESEAGEADEKV